MRQLNYSGLTNILLLVLTFVFGTLAYVFTTPDVQATKEPAKIFQFNPEGSMKALIDLDDARVISLESTTPMKDLSVVINHPDTVWMEPESSNVAGKAPPQVINHFWRTEVKTETVRDTILYNPYLVLRAKPLASKGTYPENNKPNLCPY